MATLPKLKSASRPSVAPAVGGKKLSSRHVASPSVESPESPESRPIAAAKAKAHFSALLAQVEQSRRPILISKRGKVIAHLVPAPEPEKISNFDRIFGSMRGTGRVTGDIVSPDWDAWGPEWR